jgi:hypothetical protein
VGIYKNRRRISPMALVLGFSLGEISQIHIEIKREWFMGSRVASEEPGVIEITAHLCLIG